MSIQLDRNHPRVRAHINAYFDNNPLYLYHYYHTDSPAVLARLKECLKGRPVGLAQDFFNSCACAGFNLFSEHDYQETKDYAAAAAKFRCNRMFN